MQSFLFEAQIKQSNRTVTAYVFARSEARATALVRHHMNAIGRRYKSITFRRFDTILEGHHRLGLDEILRSPSEGFASLVSSVGWILHSPVVHRLKLFQVKNGDKIVAHVVAPTFDMAAEIWGEWLYRRNCDHLRYDFEEGMASLTRAQQAAMKELLDHGPVGIAEWINGGWSVG
ncbi:hypothetical protein EKN06_00530 [Croceicoccus ponticola]|uniref:Uncharacterized protein n=1 Tax=Croceicoccus ponticola TaxID=2217664 RepID=A0A437GZI3_9SPHN|nr:hypothetical protein [Croceicoccus ponticola]RVQ68755.1 hypothetical protein EKN06_00530 [Croceicoccus ponticola]